MVRRKMFIHPLIQPLYNANLLVPGYNDHLIKGPSYYSERDVDHSFIKVPPQLNFLKNELTVVEKQLLKFGMDLEEKFVCLYMRDKGYQVNSATMGHCFDVNEFYFIIDKLVEEGYFVIRMGKQVESLLDYQHPKVIDYGGKFHSDLMDIWLTYHCDFMISSGGGLCAAPVAFRKPLLYFNCDVLSFFSTAVGSLVTFRKLMRNGETVRMTEIINMSLKKLNQILIDPESQGVTIENQSNQEILKVIDEMIARINGTWVNEPESEILQDQFWCKLNEWEEFSNWHGEKMLCKIGHKYILENKKWLLS